MRASLEEARSRGWKLAILSNTDRDFIEASIARIGVPVRACDRRVGDRLVQAARTGTGCSFFEETGAPRDAHVHVAQSHYHDVVPANELGLQSIWINRYGEQHEPPPTRELADLSALPDTLDELVAA